MKIRFVKNQKGTTYALWQEGNLAILGMPVYISVIGAQIKAHYIMAETGWERTTIRRNINTEYGYRLGVAYKIPKGIKLLQFLKRYIKILKWVKDPLDVMENAIWERGHLDPSEDPNWHL